nr:hypothetical protein [Tanacetum cinerariifolium]
MHFRAARDFTEYEAEALEALKSKLKGIIEKGPTGEKPVIFISIPYLVVVEKTIRLFSSQSEMNCNSNYIT